MMRKHANFLKVFLLLISLPPAVDSYGQSANAMSGQTDGATTPKKGFFSSLGDSLKQAIDPKAVRGYFDIGGQRYYCLVDTKTGTKQANAVQGQLVSSGSDHMTLTNPTQSSLSCDQAEISGALVLSPGMTSHSSVTSAADGVAASPAAINANVRPSSDPASWEILGIKLGVSAENASQIVLSRYPKAAKVDGRVKLASGQFAGGEDVVTGTNFVDGLAEAPGFDGKYYTRIRGSDALGSDSEKIVLGYVWPSNGTVLLVSREHEYGKTNGVISGIPSIASIREQLFAKFGTPNIEDVVKGVGKDGAPPIGAPTMRLKMGTDARHTGVPGVTWVWFANAKRDLQDARVLGACEDRIHEIVAAAEPRLNVRGISNGALTLGGGDSLCGRVMIVSAVTYDSEEFPSRLTQQLFDDDAYQKASLALREHFREREKDALNKAEQAGNAAKPVL